MDTPRLLLLPGMLNTAVAWEDVAARLADVADVRIADFSSHASIEEMASAAFALAGEAPVSVAGFSMGGFVAMEMLARAPERIARVALVDTSVRTESPRQAEARERQIEEATRDFTGSVLDEAGSTLHPERRRSDPALVARIRAMQAEVGQEGFVRHSRALMARGDYRDTLAAVRVPALVICGRQDELTPPRLSEEVAALIPGSELVWIENAGHMTPLEQPEQVAAALRRWMQR